MYGIAIGSVRAAASTPPAASARAECPARRAALAHQQREAERHEEGCEEDAVVPGRQTLKREEEPGHQPVREAAARHRTVKGPQAERHPHRHLQLEVRVVHEPVREKREHEAGDEGGARPVRERSHQEEHRGAREDEPRQEDEIVGGDPRHAEPEQRRAHERRHDHRVRERERASLRIEDVRVEEAQRITRQLMRDPREPPRREKRVTLIEADGAVEVAHLRIRHERRQQRVRNEHSRGVGRVKEKTLLPATPPGGGAGSDSCSRSDLEDIVPQRAGGARRLPESRGEPTVQRKVSNEEMPRGEQRDGPHRGHATRTSPRRGCPRARRRSRLRSRQTARDTATRSRRRQQREPSTEEPAVMSAIRLIKQGCDRFAQAQP